MFDKYKTHSNFQVYLTYKILNLIRGAILLLSALNKYFVYLELKAIS